jgi:hypothetical protein
VITRRLVTRDDLERLRLGMVMTAAMWLLLITACGPAHRDLEVVNAWDRGVTVYVVSERAGLPDQAAPIGSVRVGTTERFSAALPAGVDHFRFRYGYHAGVYEEHADLCVTREALQRADWRLVIPTTAYSCR